MCIPVHGDQCVYKVVRVSYIQDIEIFLGGGQDDSMRLHFRTSPLLYADKKPTVMLL